MLVKYSQVPTVTNEWFFQPTCRLATDERSFDDVSLVAFVAGVLRRLHKRRSRQTLRACIRHGRRRAAVNLCQKYPYYLYTSAVMAQITISIAIE